MIISNSTEWRRAVSVLSIIVFILSITLVAGSQLAVATQENQNNRITSVNNTEESNQTSSSNSSETNVPDASNNKIYLSNPDGEVYQVGQVTEAPETVQGGEQITVSGKVEHQNSNASDNIIYTIVGFRGGTVLNTSRMDSLGTGSTENNVSIPNESINAELVWYVAPVTSAERAREGFKQKASDDFDPDGHRCDPCALSIGSVNQSDSSENSSQGGGNNTEKNESSDNSSSDESDQSMKYNQTNSTQSGENVPNASNHKIYLSQPDGDVYQTGNVTNAPETIQAGEQISVSSRIEHQISEARDNIIYTVVGLRDGTILDTARMSSTGSGSVENTLTVPDGSINAEVVWYVAAVKSAEKAREGFKEKASDDFDSEGHRCDPCALSIGVVTKRSSSESNESTERNRTDSRQSQVNVPRAVGNKIYLSQPDGDVYQIGEVTSAPGTIQTEKQLTISSRVEHQVPEASDNIIYTVVGFRDGTVLDTARMSSTGSGSIENALTVPDGSGNAEVVWYVVAITSAEQARDLFKEKASDDFDSEGHQCEPCALSIGSVQQSRDTTPTPEIATPTATQTVETATPTPTTTSTSTKTPAPATEPSSTATESAGKDDEVVIEVTGDGAGFGPLVALVASATVAYYIRRRC